VDPLALQAVCEEEMVELKRELSCDSAARFKLDA